MVEHQTWLFQISDDFEINFLILGSQIWNLIKFPDSRNLKYWFYFIIDIFCFMNWKLTLLYEFLLVILERNTNRNMTKHLTKIFNPDSCFRTINFQSFFGSNLSFFLSTIYCKLLEYISVIKYLFPFFYNFFRSIYFLDLNIYLNLNYHSRITIDRTFIYLYS